MEINITLFYNTANPATYSASAAELGDNAGRITWDNAVQRSTLGSMLLDTPDKLEAMRKWAVSTGAWSAKEVTNWSDVEVNALFIQLVAGDMREMQEMDGVRLTWEEYETLSNDGVVSGLLFRGIDGQIYYLLES